MANPIHTPGEPQGIRDAYDETLDGAVAPGHREPGTMTPRFGEGRSAWDLTPGASTCPRCNGTGDDPNGGDCVMCHGHKTI